MSIRKTHLLKVINQSRVGRKPLKDETEKVLNISKVPKYLAIKGIRPSCPEHGAPHPMFDASVNNRKLRRKNLQRSHLVQVLLLQPPKKVLPAEI